MSPGAAVQMLMYRLLFVLLLASIGACSVTRISPPVKPHEPAPVFVLEHGRSTSIVLSAADGSLHRYAYGDWEYYAKRQTGSGWGVAALFWPTPAGLGRRSLSGPPTAASIYKQLRIGIDKLHVLEVERTGIDNLRDQLDALFAATPSHYASPQVDLEFVPHPAAYHLFHNSNQLVADWLTQLGCEVSTRPVLTGWSVVY